MVTVSEAAQDSAVYLAGPLGFSEAGRFYHSRILVPAIRALGATVLDPWKVSRELYDRAAQGEMTLGKANLLVGEANEKAIRHSSVVLAILDGADVDSGTAAEIGFAAGLPRPVVGLRTDIRAAGDNHEASINLQVEYFIRRSGGTMVTTLETALDAVRGALELSRA